MNIKDELAPFFSDGKRYAVMGVGSELRNDDAAGMHFAKTLAALRSEERLTVLEGSTAPENFTGVIKAFKPDLLFIVDAAFMGLEVGEIRLLDGGSIGGISFSTHMLPLPLMLDYLEAECGCRTVILGIQPQNTEQGLEMCEAVRRAAERLAETFARLI